MEPITVVIVVALAYLCGMGAYNSIIMPLGISYRRFAFLAFVYYVTIAGVFLFSVLGTPYIEAYLAMPQGALIALCALGVVLLATPLVVRRFRAYTRIADAYPRVAVTAFRYEYVLAKTGEILFQQICVVLLVFALFDIFGTLPMTAIAYAFTFALMHAPLFFVLRARFAAAFTLAAFASGFVIPPLVLLLEGGVVYSFVVHWGFYIGFVYFIYASNGRWFLPQTQSV